MTRRLVPLLALALWACGPSESVAPVQSVDSHDPHAGDDPGRVVWFNDGAALEAALVQGGLTLERGTPFAQVGVMFDHADPGPVLASVRGTDGRWSAPQPVEITWREGVVHVGRLLLDAPATAIRVEGLAGASYGYLEFFETVVARPEAPTAAQLGLAPHSEPMPLPWLGDGQPPLRAPASDLAAPGAAPADAPAFDGLATVGQAAALPDFVVTRAGWGARSPDLVCGEAHDPYWITIHHTATPFPDTISTAQRLRGVQAFHMDSNGWCDIGYHFLVGPDGTVYQGRSSEERTGAHVGGANTNNVGVSYIGDFTTAVPPTAMIEGGAKIVRWLSDTFTIPLDRDRLRGHRQWGSTSCPGDQLYSRLETILTEAGGTDPGPDPDPDPTAAVDLDVRWVALSDRHTGGSSSGVLDTLEGQRWQAEVLLTNRSPGPIRGVELGFSFEAPYLNPVNWSITTDHPRYDQATWAVNSADTEPTNPPRDGLAGTGRLVMHAFSSGETKRVLLDFAGAPPSIGQADQPDLRVWLRNINDVYGPQTRFDTAPTLNLLGRNVNDFVEVDILSEDAWFFDAPADPDNTEGWVGDDAATTGDVVLNAQGMLAVEARGATPTVRAPSWTRIDADRFDELVLLHQAHEGDHTLQLSWTRDGERFDASRTVRFAMPGDSIVRTARLPMGEHPEWRGDITGLRLVLNLNAEVGADVSPWYDVDALYLQSSIDRSTTDPRGPFVDQPTTPIDWADLDPGEDVGPAPDAGSDTGPGPDAGPSDDVSPGPDAGPSDDTSPDPGPDTDTPDDDGSDPGPRPRPDDDEEDDGSTTQSTSAGACAAAARPNASPLFFVAAALLALRRIRRIRH
jgi:hypothetical protein